MAQQQPATQSTAIVQPQKKKLEDLRALFERQKNAIHAILPKHLSPEKLIKITISAVSRNPQLLACTQESIFLAVLQAADLGLEFGPLGHAYLVPFHNKKRTPAVYECTFIPGYKGLIDLAHRGGHISTIEAHLVRKRDDFELQYGLDPKLSHKPLLDGSDPGDVLFAYAVAVMKDGTKKFDHMTLADLNAVRAKSLAQDGPWGDEQARPEMYKKTMIKRIIKMIPMSKELARAVQADNAHEMGEQPDLSEMFDRAPELESVAVPALDAPAKGGESLKEKLAAKVAEGAAVEREPGQD